jgi:hypothetical protein
MFRSRAVRCFVRTHPVDGRAASLPRHPLSQAAPRNCVTDISLPHFYQPVGLKSSLLCNKGPPTNLKSQSLANAFFTFKIRSDVHSIPVKDARDGLLSAIFSGLCNSCGNRLFALFFC